MKYRIRVQEFGEEAISSYLKTTEEEALRQYDATRTSLMFSRGGYVQLFESNNRNPIKAERIGYDRYSTIEE